MFSVVPYWSQSGFEKIISCNLIGFLSTMHTVQYNPSFWSLASECVVLRLLPCETFYFIYLFQPLIEHVVVSGKRTEWNNTRNEHEQQREGPRML